MSATVNPIATSPFARRGVPLSSLVPSEIDTYFKDTLAFANDMLKKRGIEVVFLGHTPQEPQLEYIDHNRDLLLGIKQTGVDGEEPIDIIDLKALQTNEIKTSIDLFRELERKIDQHLAAKTTSGIVFSSTGSKFDTRPLQNHTFSIDAMGYVRIDSHRLAMKTPKEEFLIVPAGMLRSYTILRLIEEGSECVRITDDHDIVREDGRGMYVDLSKIHQISADRLLPRSQEDAQSYEGNYLLIERDSLSQEKKEQIYTVLQTLKP